MGILDNVGNFLKRISPIDDGKANNDIFPQNVDQLGNVISGTNLAKDPVIVTRKTEDTNTKPEEFKQKTITSIIPTDKKNILSTYRSYTYRFTLACLSRDEVDDPSKYTKENGLDLIILRSGGKQAGAMQSRGVASAADLAAHANLINGPQELNIPLEDIIRSKKNIETMNQNPKLVENFNRYSAGQYDMFMENVQIDTIAAFTKTTNTTLPTTMTFDVIEPYSVNGFLEALGVAARVAGWNSYAEAAFVLLVEFIGYPDGDGISDPKIIPVNRYFTIGFSKMDIEITERGTVYKCEAFSWGERGNGVAGKLTSSITANGNDIGEILTDLMKQFNKQLTIDREKQFKDAGPKSELHDTYEIRFDGFDSTNNNFIPGGDTGTGKSSIKGSLLYDNQDSKQIPLLDPQNTPDGVNYADYKNKGSTTTNYTYTVSAGSDKKSQVSFKSDQNLRDIISEIVVNSKYIRGILENLYGEKGEQVMPDSANGMIDYFMVRVETKETKERDELLNKPVRKYIFVVSPYKVHRTRFPSFGNLRQNLIELQKNSLRSYNYIYTGKNTEILSFKLQYNYMYFEGIPKGMAINDRASQVNSSAPDGSTTPVKDSSKTEDIKKRNEENSRQGQNATPSIRTIPGSEEKNRQGNSILRQDDPYYALSSNLHNALTDPTASMLLAEMDILGDPYFLCTGGIGNQLKTNDSKNTIGNDQAPILYGDMIIDVRFNNPQDINSDSKSPGYGFIKYNEINSSPFHGAYRVIKITNYFREGVFKQHLELNKISGQDENNTLQIIDRESGTVEKSSDGGTVTSDARDTTDKSLPKQIVNANNPPNQPNVTDLTVALSVDDQNTLKDKGLGGLAKATGVNIKELSPSLLASNPEAAAALEKATQRDALAAQALATGNTYQAAYYTKLADVARSNAQAYLENPIVSSVDNQLATNTSPSDQSTLNSAYKRYLSGNKSGTTFIS
jgi:hypothetical protein